ncbi:MULTISPECIES: hypothetical protein [unclassified Agrococcus]|uniref:hypothetical protein n=1 Tax=unclassified Agrococcus TaxID=2615065 RepID=UPI003608A3A9
MKRPAPRRLLAASLALVAASVLAGCIATPGPAPVPSPTASASPTASQSPSEPTPTPTPTPAAPQEDPANPVPLPESTPPGTTLAIGDSMVVRNAVGVLEESEGWSILRYTVSAIERGDDAYLQGIDGAEAYQAGGTVWYVRGRVEVVALFGRGIDGIVGGTIAGIQSDGQGAAGVLDFGGEAPGCSGGFMVSGAQVGAAVDTCIVALALPGTQVTGASFYGDGTVPNGGTSTDPYWIDPIVWLP